MTAQEIAKELNFNIQTIYRFTKQGKIPYIKLGGAIRFDKEAIDKWLINNTTTCGPSDNKPTPDTPEAVTTDK
jgi:excisionase family DNA binding protein